MSAMSVKNEDGGGAFFKKVLFISILVHVVVLTVNIKLWISHTDIQPEEWVINADVMPDFDLGASEQSALPNAEKAKEIKVEKQILPQLPDKFEVEEKPAKEDTVSEEEILKAEKKKEAAKKEAKREELAKKKAEEKRKQYEKKSQEAKRKKKEEQLVKVKKKEALERLLKEQARKEKKFAAKTSAPLSKKLAQRKSELESNSAGISGGASGLSQIKMKKYQASLFRAIKRNYSLPEVYNYAENADITTKIAISISINGNLNSVKIIESSGDAVYDSLSKKAIVDADPLPKPPKEFINKRIIIAFSPKTF